MIGKVERLYYGHSTIISKLETIRGLFQGLADVGITKSWYIDNVKTNFMTEFNKMANTDNRLDQSRHSSFIKGRQTVEDLVDRFPVWEDDADSFTNSFVNSIAGTFGYDLSKLAGNTVISLVVDMYIYLLFKEIEIMVTNAEEPRTLAESGLSEISQTNLLAFATDFESEVIGQGTMATHTANYLYTCDAEADDEKFSPDVTTLPFDFVAGEVVVFTAGTGSLPTGITANVPYIIRDVDATGETFKVTTTYDDEPGTALNITGDGTGFNIFRIGKNAVKRAYLLGMFQMLVLNLTIPPLAIQKVKGDGIFKYATFDTVDVVSPTTLY